MIIGAELENTYSNIGRIVKFRELMMTVSEKAKEFYNLIKLESSVCESISKYIDGGSQ